MRESAYNSLLIESIIKMPRETGGVLIGYWGNNQEAVVTAVIGPGPKAVHKKRSFKPDHVYHVEQISQHYYASGRTETYLGDWHTHPKAGAYLSDRDLKTLHAIGNYEQARLNKPLMMILGTNPFELKVWAARDQKAFRLLKPSPQLCQLLFF